MKVKNDTDNNTKILVIGLEQLGLRVAKYVWTYMDIYGYDISTKAIGRAEKIAEIEGRVMLSRTSDSLFIAYSR